MREEGASERGPGGRNGERTRDWEEERERETKWGREGRRHKSDWEGQRERPSLPFPDAFTISGPFSMKRPNSEEPPGPPCNHSNNGASLSPL